MLHNYADSEFNLPQGVYIFLGYSIKDEKLLKAVTNKSITDSVADIHGLAYHYNINNNKVWLLVLNYLIAGFIPFFFSLRYTVLRR